MKNTPIERHLIDETINEFQIVDFSKATIREVKAIASKAEAASGVEFIKMEMGVPGLPPSAVGVKAEIAALQNGIASLYPDINGLPELKKEASNFIKAFINVDLSPEGCVPVTGSMQGTFASFLTCKAEKNDRIYGLVFHQRLYPKYMKIKEMIDSGEIGTLKRVSLINSRYLRTSHYHKSGSWRSSFAGEGGGALINQGQHILDIFQYLFGMPQRLFAVIPFGKYNPFAVDDEDTIVMEYNTGMTASFILTTGEACCEERMEIIGTKARLLLEDNTLSITRFDDIEKYIKTEDVNSREHLHFTEEKIMYEKSAEPYTQLLEKFAQAALKHDEGCLVAKGAEGLHSLMLCAGAYYSACKGIRVDLPLDAMRYKELMDNLIEDEKNAPVM